MASINNAYVNQLATAPEYTMFEFKNKAEGANTATFTWQGKSSIAPSASIVKLQVYNRNSTLWEDKDTDNATGVDTQFELTFILPNTADYVDINGWIACRVWQKIQ